MNAVTVDTKRCSKCQCDRPRSEFYAKNTASDGLMSSCKRCNAGRVEPGARQWALAELAGRHPEEFTELYEHAKSRARGAA